MPAMQRRQILKTLPAALLLSPAMTTAAKAAPRVKITDIRLVPLKTLRELGKLEPAWAPGSTMSFAIGGGAYLEIHSDQGAVGIGPAMDVGGLARIKALLVGHDPFDVERFYGPLRSGGTNRIVASVEIALWDLIGKIAQQPIYKLWGADKDRVQAYCSLIQLSTPEERAKMAAGIKAQGWKAIKVRLHHETMREDIRTIELVRKAVGDGFTIFTDANQAQSASGWQPGVRWDYRRALETARELEKLNVFWLEEPLPRYDWDGLAALNKEIGIKLVGGENNVGIHEFREMLDRQVFDAVQPDVMVADGVTGFRQIAALAAAHNKNIYPHHGGGNFGTVAQLHAIASFPNAPFIEILNEPPVGDYRNGFSVFENPPLVDADGFMALPQGPGLGIEINKALLA
jgi:D-galactarolactone cycloisomerase